MKYELLNAEDQHKAHPKTFHIEDRETRELLDKGDHAKLLFEIPEEQREEGEMYGERMWVLVTRCYKNGRYAGVLINAPIVVDLRHGQHVRFGPENILNIQIDVS